MKTLQDELDQVTEQLRAAKEERARLDARIRGLTVERDTLAAAIEEAEGAAAAEDADDLSGLRKDRAIVAVLRRADGPLDISGIVDALHANGRPHETYNAVSVYLTWMVKTGLVRRIERGSYVPA